MKYEGVAVDFGVLLWDAGWQVRSWQTIAEEVLMAAPYWLMPQSLTAVDHDASEIDPIRIRDPNAEGTDIPENCSFDREVIDAFELHPGDQCIVTFPPS